MKLLSPPTHDMRLAARALIHDPRTVPHLDDATLRAAVEQVRSELSAYDEGVFRNVDGKPSTSQEREALELAVAQRISSAHLELNTDGEAKDVPPASPSPRARRRTRGR